MERIKINPRPNIEQYIKDKFSVNAVVDGGVYWNEAAYYKFTKTQIEAIETASNELHSMFIEAGEKVIASDSLMEKFGIPKYAWEYIRASWEKDNYSLYGRFDLAFDGTNIKLLEYNADTPTSLLEASVVQWDWFENAGKKHASGFFKKADQFNLIHESLIKQWKWMIDNFIPKDSRGGFPWPVPVHFSCMDNEEDNWNTCYLMDTALAAGLVTKMIRLSDIGYDKFSGKFVDTEEDNIKALFKLYPWENMLQEEFGQYVCKSDMMVIEPAWKVIFSNKAILAVLWEMYPKHKYLLPTYFENIFLDNYVEKKFISREGQNIRKIEGGVETTTDGDYDGDSVFQQLFKIPCFDGNYPVIGSWMVGGESCGIGIREDDTSITTNMSRFVPHVFL